MITEITNPIQIVLGVTALIILILKINKDKTWNVLKGDFHAKMFIVLFLMVAAESLEHSSELIKAVIEPYVSRVYVLASGFLLFLLFSEYKK